MNSRENVFRLYPNMGYWLLLFIPLTVAGFYFTYFTKLDLPQPSIIHFHFILMAIWMGIVIAQPLLIRYKNPQLHRKIGKLSYFVVPILAISTWLMIRHSFQLQTTNLEAQIAEGSLTTSVEEAKIQIANFLSIAFVYLFWLVFFYILAIWNRKNHSIHARYMVAAALTFIGPTIDRILIFWFEFYGFGPGLPVEIVGFVLIDLILLFLLFRDLQTKKSPIPYLVSLSTYLILQVFDVKFTMNSIWESFVRTLLN